MTWKRAFTPIARIQKACHELEQAALELKQAVEEDAEVSRLARAETVGASVRSVERALSAVRNVLNRVRPREADRSLAELRSLWRHFEDPALGVATARILALATQRAAEPSAAARALALLLERPRDALSAAEVAERLGCSVPIARTTLHRLVASGHADRVGRGRFRARG